MIAPPPLAQDPTECACFGAPAEWIISFYEEPQAAAADIFELLEHLEQHDAYLDEIDLFCLSTVLPTDDVAMMIGELLELQLTCEHNYWLLIERLWSTEPMDYASIPWETWKCFLAWVGYTVDAHYADPPTSALVLYSTNLNHGSHWTEVVPVDGAGAGDHRFYEAIVDPEYLLAARAGERGLNYLVDTDGLATLEVNFLPLSR